MASPAVGTSLIIRVETQNSPNAFANLASAIADAGGTVSAVDTRTVGRTATVRDVTITIASDAVGDAVQAAIAAQDGARIVSVSDSIFLAHLGGKIHMEPNIPVRTRADLSTVYTPGRRARLDGDRRTIPPKRSSSRSSAIRSRSSPTVPQCSVSATSARSARCR